MKSQEVQVIDNDSVVKQITRPVCTYPSNSLPIKCTGFHTMNPSTPRPNPHDPLRLLARARPHHQLSFYSRSTIKDVPFELLLEIFKDLSKDDLMALRIVCKQFAVLLAPLVFSSVLLVANAKKLEDAKLILSHFPASIKTIYISPINHVARTQAKYENAVDRNCRPEHIRFPQCHLDLGYKAYCKLRKEQQEIMATREISIVLCQILNNAPKVSRLAIISSPELTNIAREELQEYCTKSNCGLSLETHSLLRLPAETASECGMLFVPSILLALSTASRPIPEILAGSHVYYMRIPASCLRMSTRQEHNFYPITSSLTKLALSLEVTSVADEQMVMDGTFASILASAAKLECLFLRITERNHIFPTKRMPFDALFHECRFPRLKHLLLAGIESDARSLMIFILHSTHIKSLALRYHHITSGHWGALADLLRKRYKFTRIQLYEISGGFVKTSYPSFKEHDVGMIHDYFFRGGENPFAEGAVERYSQSHGFKQRPNRSRYGGSYSDREWYQAMFGGERI